MRFLCHSRFGLQVLYLTQWVAGKLQNTSFEQETREKMGNVEGVGQAGAGHDFRDGNKYQSLDIPPKEDPHAACPWVNQSHKLDPHAPKKRSRPSGQSQHPNGPKHPDRILESWAPYAAHLRVERRTQSSARHYLPHKPSPIERRHEVVRHE